MNSSTRTPKSLQLFYLRHRLRARGVILLISLLATLTGLFSPVFQKTFVDRLMGAESIAMGLMGLKEIEPLHAILIAVACTLLSQSFSLIVGYLATKEGTILQKIVSEELYHKMLSIRSDSMGNTTVGEVVSLYATDVPGGTALIDQVMPMAMNIVFPLILAPVAIHWLCGIPLWATISVMVMIVVLTMTLASRQSRYFSRFKQLAAERTGIVNEWIQTIRLLRILGWIENFEKKIFAKRIEETENRVTMVTNGQLMNSFGSSINYVINLTGVASLIFLSGRQATPGELFALLWIFGVFLVRPFRQLPWFFTFWLDSTTSIRRIEKFLARPSDAGTFNLRSDERFTQVRGKPVAVSVRGLNLEIGGHKILDEVDFDLAPGEFVAIVGEVGAGKSMLALSLVGETGASFRKFTVGDVDALQLNLHDRRSHFGFVPQDGFVMSATLRENIVFQYEPPAEKEAAVFKSLEVANFKMSEELQGSGGLEIELGERGVNLSGGQRQRVALARAHQFDRDVILLDDCLSAVDVDTERNLLADLFNGAWRHRTRLLITHRLSVLSLVDRVFFMENGRIVESGRFSDLLQRSERMKSFVASVQRSEEGSPTAVTAASATATIEAEPQEKPQVDDGASGVMPEGGADVVQVQPVP